MKNLIIFLIFLLISAHANADSTICGLNPASTLTGSECISIMQGGLTVKTTTSALASFGGSGTVTSITAGTGLTGGTITTTGTIAIGTTAVTAASYGSATASPTYTVNAQGQLTAAANVTITPAVGSITGFGTNVAAALANTLNAASGIVGFSGALGTPTSGVATNLTGTATALNIGGNAATATTATNVAVGGITGLGTGIATWLATPSSANLAAALTDKTGTGTTVFAASPTLSGTITGGTFSGTHTGGGSGLTGIGTASLGGITGTPSNTTFLRGDGTWSTPIAKADSVVINGNMLIDQQFEGGSITIGSTSAIIRTLDEWEVVNTHWAGVTTQRVVDAPAGFITSQKVTVGTGATAGAGDFLIIVQPVEGPDWSQYDSGSANASTVSINWYTKTNVTGNFGFLIANNADTRGNCTMETIGSANTWTNFTINGLLLDTTGTWQTNANTIGAFLHWVVSSGSSAQGTCGSWQASAGLGNSTQTNFAATSSNTFQLAGVRLAAESIAQPFVTPSFPLQIQQTARFYKKSFPQGTAVAQNAGVAGATCTKNPIALGDPSTYVNLSRMSGSPTFTTYNPSATNANWRNVTASADVTVSVDASSAKGDTGIEIATSGTVTTLGNDLCIHWTADTRL